MEEESVITQTCAKADPIQLLKARTPRQCAVFLEQLKGGGEASRETTESNMEGERCPGQAEEVRKALVRKR